MNPIHKQLILQTKGRTTIYNRGPALKNWDNKLNDIKAGNNDILDIAVIGDSISEGYILTADTATLLANAFKWKLSTYFNGRYDDVGKGFLHHIYPSLSQLTSYTGTWTTTNYSFTNYSTTTTEQNATISFPFTGTGAELWIQKNATLGSIGVSIDSGDEQVMSLADETGFPVRMTIASELENTTHTVTITNKEAKRIHFSGYMEHKGTRGVRVHMCSKTGQSSQNFTDATRVLPWYTLLNPDLVVINLGTNDYMNNLNPATFKTNLQTLITHLKGLETDIIIMTDGTNDRTGYTYNWQQYLDAMKEVALSNNCCFIDTHIQWHGANNARANDLIPVGSATDIHPTIAGHNQIYTTLRDVIDPS